MGTANRRSSFASIIICLTWNLILFFQCTQAQAIYPENTRPANDPLCEYPLQLDQQRCQQRIAMGCPLFWYGASCLGKADGGCRHQRYCGFKCKSRCEAFSAYGCVWEYGQCEYKLSAEDSHPPTPPAPPTLSPIAPPKPPDYYDEVCWDDSDCRGSLVCFNPNRTHWVNSSHGFCGCSRARALVGSNCTENTGSSDLDVAILVVYLIIEVQIFVWWTICVYGFRYLLTISSALTHVSIALIISALAGTCWMCLCLLCSSGIAGDFISKGKKKTCSLDNGIIAMAAVCGVCFALAVLNICAIWKAMVDPDEKPEEAMNYTVLGIIAALALTIAALVSSTSIFWVGFALATCLVLAIIYLHLRGQVSARGSDSESGKHSNSDDDIRCRENSLDMRCGSMVMLLLVISSIICGILSYIRYHHAGGWPYEFSVWDRPSHWCFRVVQGCIVLCTILIFLCLRRLVRRLEAEAKDHQIQVFRA